ncbi:hypothetical protein G3O08_19090 [Cryomorpha ignava]|uniref:Uncharacterized protein n=1 Tax=Cryomorpha ignava TaxID=101383 RepID=A0A7K3WXL8_9FLAO|nr:hypothetical protein [Cryomorpha ignava]NEN25602.1 hypothetical protein [Cryomorpha ignava]
MKTKSIFTLLFIFIVVTLCGQVPQPQFEVTDSTVDLSIAIDAVIEDLDLTDVTTNILYDRGWKLGSLDNFDGALTADARLRQYDLFAIRIVDG